MELTFLGTSAGVPTRTRNMTSIILNLQQPTRAEMWLFDCGEGTQHQFLHTPYHPGKLNKIFITHLHGDHLFGLPGLLCSRVCGTPAAPKRRQGNHEHNKLRFSFKSLSGWFPGRDLL